MAIQEPDIYLSTRRFRIIPKSLQTRAIRLAFETLGLLLFALTAFIALSFISYNPLDPSFNTSTDISPTNWFGVPGARIADFFFQTFGRASYAVPLPLFFISLGLLIRSRWRTSKSKLILQFSSWPLFLLAAATFLSTTTSGLGWQLKVGPGGFVGDFLSALLVSGISQLNVLAPSEITLIITLLLSIIFGLLACGAAAIQPVKLASQISLMGRQSLEMASRMAGKIKTVVDSAISLPHRWRNPLNGTSNPATEFQSSQIQTRGDLDHEEYDDETHENGPNWAVPIIRNKKTKKPGKREHIEAQPMLNLEQNEEFQLPPLGLLAKPKKSNDQASITDDSLEQNARLLEKVLDDFGVRGEIIGVRPGPVVTLYELEPAAGIKSSRVIGLADDIARSMSAIAARVAVIPGRNVIGIELPNSKRETVFLRELFASSEYENANSRLALALGKDISGEPIMGDLASMPHLLIAGTTGSGKSVGINAMILSILFRMSPNQCKLILVDPKMLELSVYDGIPHLLSPVVTDPKKAVVALKWVVKEMEDRYRKMSKLGVRNITGFNERCADAVESGEVLTRRVQTGFDKEAGTPVYEEEELPLEPMPFIVVVVDEMADLMMVAGKDIEAAVQRLAQMARAAGIHLIAATQRPSVDVITGTIKANFPTRISFQVTSKIDSRTILGEQGGEQLLGQGDMLYMTGGGRIKRLHGPFVSDQEVEKVVKFLKKQGTPEYLEDVTEAFDTEEADALLGLSSGTEGGDELYDQAVAVVLRDGKASTSYVQRRLQIGYNRAARIVERMEDEGVISGPNHSGKREVLMGEHAQH